MPIQTIYCNPAISIARLGASTVPMDAFTWVASDNPRIIGETRIQPTWTLDVQPDGSVAPRLPDRIVLRDGANLRPVAPFVEVWCGVGDSGDPDNWVHQPLTTRLLRAEGLNVANLTFEITAMNLKAARRTGNDNLGFGVFEPVRLRGDNHTSTLLRAVSPSNLRAGAVAMIPRGRFIPMGRVQVIRPGAQPKAGSTPWDAVVNVETVRIRYTPAVGTFYGPPALVDQRLPDNDPRFEAVPAENAFLNADAGWDGANPLRSGFVNPWDTYDGAERSRQLPDGSIQAGLSYGVVDDTCEVRIAIQLDQAPIGQTVLNTQATIWVGPPDYALDRRPFLSLADSINDRAGDKDERSQALSAAERDRWIEDLFERTFETLSLMNVDIWRNDRGAQLSGDHLNSTAIPGDDYRYPDRAMGGRDRLRNPNIAMADPSDNVPLPMSDRAKERHRDLSDIAAIKDFILENPQRLEALIRPPFAVASNENPGATTMQMPPFMRNSNAQPLTLTEWQYNLLMAWQAQLLAAGEGAPRDTTGLSENANTRRAAVLRTLEGTDGLTGGRR